MVRKVVICPHASNKLNIFSVEERRQIVASSEVVSRTYLNEISCQNLVTCRLKKGPIGGMRAVALPTSICFN